MFVFEEAFNQVAYHSEGNPHSSLAVPSVVTNNASAPSWLKDTVCFYEGIEGPETNKIQAVVASGKSFNDMGNYDMCNNASGTQYCTVSMLFNNASVSGLKFGVCVASNCSEDNVSAVVQAVLDY